MSVNTLMASPDFDSMTEPEEYKVVKVNHHLNLTALILYVSGDLVVLNINVMSKIWMPFLILLLICESLIDVCLLTFRHWKINVRMALIWNPSYAMMATFKISSKTSRSVFTLRRLLSFEFVFGLHSTVYVWAWFVFPFRNPSILPLTRQECTHTRWSVFGCSIKRTRVWIWMLCSDRIMVIYFRFCDTFLTHYKKSSWEWCSCTSSSFLIRCICICICICKMYFGYKLWAKTWLTQHNHRFFDKTVRCFTIGMLWHDWVHICMCVVMHVHDTNKMWTLLMKLLLHMLQQVVKNSVGYLQRPCHCVLVYITTIS